MSYTIYRAVMHENHHKIETCNWERLVVIHTDKAFSAREMAIDFARRGYPYDRIGDHVHCIFGYAQDGDPEAMMNVIHIYEDYSGEDSYDSDFDVYNYHYIAVAMTVIGDFKKVPVWSYFPKAERPDGKREMVKSFSELIDNNIDQVYVWDMCTGQRGYVDFSNINVQIPDIKGFLRGDFSSKVSQPWRAKSE